MSMKMHWALLNVAQSCDFMINFMNVKEQHRETHYTLYGVILVKYPWLIYFLLSSLIHIDYFCYIRLNKNLV